MEIKEKTETYTQPQRSSSPIITRLKQFAKKRPPSITDLRSKSEEIIVNRDKRSATNALKTSKELFKAETISVKSTDDIRKELQRVFRLLNIQYRSKDVLQTKFTCIDSTRDVKFRVEICKIDVLDGLKGVKLKKKKGRNYDWSATEENLNSLLKL